MAREHMYYVYILSSRSRNLYIGVTNKLYTRVREHREGRGSVHTAKFSVHRLVYFQRFQYVNNAIAREKYLKHFTRAEKLALITASNPTWEDLAARLDLPGSAEGGEKKADPPPAAKDDKVKK